MPTVSDQLASGEVSETAFFDSLRNFERVAKYVRGAEHQA